MLVSAKHKTVENKSAQYRVKKLTNISDYALEKMSRDFIRAFQYSSLYHTPFAHWK